MSLTAIRYARIIVFLLVASFYPYFFLIFGFTSFTYPLTLDPFLNFLFNRFFLPGVFSLPWILLGYLYRDHLVGAFILLRQDTSLIPARWRIFYGFNAAIIAIFLGFPLGTPVVLALCLYVLIGRIIGRIVSVKNSPKLVWAVWLIFCFLLSIPYGILLINYFPDVMPFFFWLIENWIAQINILYLMATLIVSTITLTSLLDLLYDFKKSRDVTIYGMKFTDTPKIGKYVLKILMFFVLFYFATDSSVNRSFMNMLSTAGLVIGVFSTMVRSIFKVKFGHKNRTLIGFIFATLFLVLYILEISNILVLTGIMFLAALLFGLVFIRGVTEGSEIATIDNL